MLREGEAESGLDGEGSISRGGPLSHALSSGGTGVELTEAPVTIATLFSERGMLPLLDTDSRVAVGI